MSHLITLVRKWEDMANKWNKMIQDKNIEEGSEKRVYLFVRFASLVGNYLHRAQKL